jgi:ClpP class serine protease
MSKILLHALARGFWAVDPNYAQSQLNYLGSLFSGESLDFNPDAHVKFAKVPQVFVAGTLVEIEAHTWYGKQQLSMIPKGSSVVVPVSGPIMKEDFCYSPGSMTIAKWISSLDQNPNCNSIILSIDSPGGMVDGTQTLADTIKACSTKTIAFINDGTAASAAYWIASAADEIVSSHATNQIGSIGVFVQLANWEKHYKEQHKLEIKSFYSDLSEEKNEPFIKALDGDDKLIKVEMLNPIARAFISAVKTNRAGKLNLSAGNPFKGKLFMSQNDEHHEDAIRVGLIDRIASLESVIHSSGGFSTLSASIANTHTTMKKISIPAAFANLLAFFSATVESGKDKVEVEASEDKFNELLKKADANLGLDAQVADLTSQLDASQKVVGERDATIVSLNDQINKLKGSAGSGPHSVVKTDADPENVDADLMDFEKEAIAANKAAKAARIA